MTEKNISLLPQDVTVDIAKLIREVDPKAIIYPTSIVLTEAHNHFTKKEIRHIIRKQKELFNISSKEVRVFVIKSDKLTQDKISSLLYFKK